MLHCVSVIVPAPPPEERVSRGATMKKSLRTVALACLPLIPSLAISQTVKQVFAYPTSAAGPISTPAQGRDGSLYTTSSGDGTTHTNGAVFQTPLVTKGTRLWHTFTTADGTNPESGLTLGLDGNYYGVAPGGGSLGYGVLFEISPAGTYTILHEFTGGSDGGLPFRHPYKPQTAIYTAIQVLAA
jgi:uncharacterized repeat protein (TIGR03803 family)